MQRKRTMKWMVLVPLVLLLAVASTGTADEPQATQPSAITCGDSASCSMAGEALSVTNSGTGAAIYGRNTSAVSGSGVYGRSQQGAGVRGQSNSSNGVFATSYNTAGVRGKSTWGVGVKGESDHNDGVYGVSVNGYGVAAHSDYDAAIWAQGMALAPDLILAGNSSDFNHGIISSDPDYDGEFQIWSYYDVLVLLDMNNDDSAEKFRIKNGGGTTILEAQADGDVVVGNNMYVDQGMLLGGDIQLGDDQAYGSIMAYGTTGADLYLFANDNIYADLDQDNNTSNSCFRIRSGTDSVVWLQCETKGTTTVGSQAVAVETNSGTREMHALGSPGVWFEDFGSAALVDGQVTVTIDPLFRETVNTDDAYHVFLTPLGDCNGLYVTNKTPTSFEVHELGGGTSSTAFDYRIVANRLGYEGQRLEQVDLASPEEEAP